MGLLGPAWVPRSISRRCCQGCRVSGIHRSDRLRSRRPLTAAAGYATSCNFAFAIAAGHVFHAKIPFCSPLLSRHIPQSGANQHQSRLSVRKSADNAGSSPDLTVHALNNIVCADLQPVLGRKIHIGQRFLNPVLHLFRRFLQLHRAELLYNVFCFLPRRFLALLCMDCLEHS